jgi:hypothetical protein
MHAAGMDIHVTAYGRAMQGFTNRGVNWFGRPGNAYHEPSDARSLGGNAPVLAKIFGSYASGF